MHSDLCRNLQLKKIRRTEKKGTESVMDEKFSVLFWTEFQVSELRFQLWTLSLPVVVIVHGNQEPQALATVVWDNGFAEWGRRPFYVPNKVTWGQAASALNMKWAAACGSPLTEDNLYYLACKALRWVKGSSSSSRKSSPLKNHDDVVGLSDAQEQRHPQDPGRVQQPDPHLVPVLQGQPARPQLHLLGVVLPDPAADLAAHAEALEGGLHHGLRGQGHGREDAPGEAQRDLPAPLLRLRAGRRHHRLRPETGPLL